MPGEFYMQEDIFGKYGCDYFRTYGCDQHGVNGLLLMAMETDNGFITPLNCPICGCTENDIITLDERKSGTRSMSMIRKEFRAQLGLE